MSILLTGASGVVGAPLATRCEVEGRPLLRCTRRHRGAEWLVWDLSEPPPPWNRRIECLVHTAPLWLLPAHVSDLAKRGVRRIIGFSSTSALTKTHSANHSERALAQALSRAEGQLLEACARHAVAVTVFRPAMIYGYGRDANVSTIARFIRRYRCFVVAGRAAGRRQPVHADDLASAVLAVLDNGNTHGRTYNLAGGETLAYRDMVVRIFRGLGRPQRIIRVPTSIYGGMLAAAGLLRPGLTASMATRMNRDMIFDTGDALADFGFSPQRFLMHPEQDLPAA